MYIFLIYIFVLDICSQHLRQICQLVGFCTPFRRKVKKCTFCNISIYIYIYLYWIYAANIWRTYMSIEFIHCSRAQLSNGPTVHFFRADNWAPGPNCPGPNCPGAQLSGAQLSGGPTVRGPIVQGPNCPGPNCPGAQLSGAQLSRGPVVRGPVVRGPTVRGPIVRGPICLEPVRQLCYPWISSS